MSVRLKVYPNVKALGFRMEVLHACLSELYRDAVRDEVGGGGTICIGGLNNSHREW